MQRDDSAQKRRTGDGRALSDEKIAEIHRLWHQLGVGSQVALAANVSYFSVVKYRPQDLPRSNRAATLHERLTDLWDKYGNSREVAEHGNVSLHTAWAHMPSRYKKPSALPTGYKTWSEETRKRWDAHWDNPTADHYEQLAKLIEGKAEVINGPQDAG